MKHAPDRVNTSIDVDLTQWEEMRRRAKSMDRTIAWCVRLAVSEWLAKPQPFVRNPEAPQAK